MLNNISGLAATYGISAYSVNSAKRAERIPSQPANSDVVTINSKGYSDKLTYTASDIASGVRASDDTARAEQIASQIQSGTYNVASSDIARSILGFPG